MNIALYIIENIDPISPGPLRNYYVLFFDPKPWCLRL